MRVTTGPTDQARVDKRLPISLPSPVFLTRLRDRSPRPAREHSLVPINPPSLSGLRSIFPICFPFSFREYRDTRNAYPTTESGAVVKPPITSQSALHHTRNTRQGTKWETLTAVATPCFSLFVSCLLTTVQHKVSVSRNGENCSHLVLLMVLW